MSVLDRETLLGQRIYWVLTFTYASATYYLSSDTFEITTQDGDSVHVLDGIGEIDWEETLGLFSDSPQSISVPFSIVIPGLDIGVQVAAGYSLESAVCELARWVTGTTWESRQVMIIGKVQEPNHGGLGEPVSFSLSQAPFDDRSSMNDAAWIIDEYSWGNADEKSYGNTYPVVFGSPGYFQDGFTKVAGSPGYIVNTTTRYLLLCVGEVNASSVWVKNIDNGTDWGSASVTTTQDARGVTVSVATLSNGTGNGQYQVGSTDGNQYVVSWPVEGAMYNRRRDNCLQLAGDILDHFLDQTTLSVDQGKTAAAATKLNQFVLAGYADEDVSTWDWIKSNLLPILPVSIVSGPSGLYPVVWPYMATSEDAIEWLDVSRLDAERTTAVQYSPVTDIANDIRITYGFDEEENAHARSMRLTGSDSYSAYFGVDLFSTSTVRSSRTRYGKAVRSLETDVVYDPQTAAKVASWVSYAGHSTTRTVSYLLPIYYRYLQLGDVVVITDSEISWSEQVCWIEGIADADIDQIEVTFRTIERPAQPRG